MVGRETVELRLPRPRGHALGDEQHDLVEARGAYLVRKHPEARILWSRLQNSVGCGLNFWIPPVSILVSGMPTGRSGPEDGSGGGQKRGNAGIDVFTAALVVTAAGRAPEVEPRFAADALSVTSPSA